MAEDSNASGAQQNAPSSALQAVQGQLPQLIGKLADANSANTGDLVTALTALAAAINAKPSA